MRSRRTYSQISAWSRCNLTDFIICTEDMQPKYKVEQKLFEKMVDTFNKLKSMGMLKGGSDRVIRNYVKEDNIQDQEKEVKS